MTETNMSSEKNAELSAKAAKFLEARGLDLELAERMGLHSRVGQSGAEVISIPFLRNGVVVNRKHRPLVVRDGGPKYFMDKGGELTFWNLEVIGDETLAERPLIVTEGELDALSAIQAGFVRTVSVPNGAPATAGEGRHGARYAYIDELRPQLDAVKEIIIASDGDGAGAALLSDLSTLLGAARCKFVRYPEGCKDLNDVLMRYGVEGVQACIADAKWVRVAGVYKLSDLPPLPPLTVWRPQVLDCIDKMIPICPGHVSIWTGLAGNGKSTLLNAVMWTIADRYGISIAHGTFESTPQREYLEEAISFRIGHPIGTREATDAAVQEARAWVQDHVVFLTTDGYATPQGEEWVDATLDWFCAAAQSAIVRHGCRIIVLDPWSQMDHDPENNEREDQYIRRILKRLKMMARAFDVHIAIVAHPAKPKRDLKGVYQMPEGYEISGGSHWSNFADLGITVHRHPPMIEGDDGEEIPDPRSTRVLIRVWKVKYHRPMNKPGDVYADVDCRTGRYMSTARWG